MCENLRRAAVSEILNPVELSKSTDFLILMFDVSTEALDLYLHGFMHCAAATALIG